MISPEPSSSPAPGSRLGGLGRVLEDDALGLLPGPPLFLLAAEALLLLPPLLLLEELLAELARVGGARRP